jgi:predicted NAD/FAD-binding protein
MSRIAVIGAGISGLAAAYLLSRKHEVSLFEREPRLGGHTHTHQIDTSIGVRPIDTGFIVYNDRTYPNLVKLFAELGIEREKSDMSFGVSCQATGIEYSSRGLRGFFATRRNIVRPAHYRFFSEILRFNRESTEFLKRPDLSEITLREYLTTNRFDGDFARLYLYPMASAVWSTSLEEMEDFPALTLLRFFDNHGFLTVNGHPQWYVLKGGSSSYIAPLTKPYRERVTVGANIASVTRAAGKVVLRFTDGGVQGFDEVVFACHAPQTLALLGDSSLEERRILGAFRTTANDTVLHKDSRLLPRSPHARASWNYHLGRDRSMPTLTYHMNRLQNIAAPEHYCVTLNAKDRIASKSVLRELQYNHPLYTLDAVRAQARWGEISGRNSTHYCGAYWFYGFHEDGFNSAIRVARSLGVEWKA